MLSAGATTAARSVVAPRALRSVATHGSVRGMQTLSRAAGALALGLVIAATAAAADTKLKAGWTPKALDAASADCTQALVQGSWENAQREQSADPAAPITASFRKEHAAEIASMKKLCACAVREGAKRYTHAEAEANPADLERAASDSIAAGTCKLAP